MVLSLLRLGPEARLVTLRRRAWRLDLPHSWAQSHQEPVHLDARRALAANISWLYFNQAISKKSYTNLGKIKFGYILDV